MGNICSGEAKEAVVATSAQIAQSKEIDKQLKKEEEATMDTAKLLLLGTGETGKSTILKQMRLIHNVVFTEDEYVGFRSGIFMNIITCSKSLIHAMDTLKIPYGFVPPVVPIKSHENEAKPAEVSDENSTPAPISIAVENSAPAEPPTESKDATDLDEAPVEPLIKRMDPAALAAREAYANIDPEIGQVGPVPEAAADILNARMMTTSISETRFEVQGVTFRVFDVGGQRSQRKKWAPYFDDVRAIIYLVAINSYDQVCFEDTSANRMVESLNVFKSMCNHPMFKSTAIILFMNKIDLFRTKLETAMIADHFPEFEVQAMLLPLALLLAACLGTTLADTRFFTLNLAYGRLAPDGFMMDMMLANGQIDYPIVVNKGDTVVVTVNNNLNVSTAIHWHGMFQVGSPWMDGAAMVTQCPIQPGDTYVYEFNVGNQVGTYWWHAHYQSQYINGLRGPFIVNDPHDPYLSQYDYDVTMTLTDFFHNGSDWLLNNVFYNENNTNAFEPLPESGLIGGVGQYNCTQTQARNPNCKNNNALKQFSVVPGKRYRFRLINTSAQAFYTFSIDNHNLTVIEADGVYTNPTVVNQIPIHSAQRYSFILTANARTSNYWIRATMMNTWDPQPTWINGLNMDVRAILAYTGASKTAPKSVAQAVPIALNAWTLGELNGMTAATLPTEYDQTFYMSFQYGPPWYTYPLGTMTINSEIQAFTASQYQMPMTPVLGTLINNLTATFPASINPVTVTNGKWVTLQIQNSDAMEHPFHIHGHTMYVLNHGNLKHQNVVNPAQTYARRDTIQVPACTGGKGGGGESGCLHGFITLAILMDNPGVWLFHCHIEWHMSAGLVMTFINNGN
ncbi:hypothetical protein HDU98_007139, partial [Podochytrium sp. JEL0797]